MVSAPVSPMKIFFLLKGIAEHIVVEKRHERPQPGKRQQTELRATQHIEDDRIEYHGYSTQSRGKPVDAVDEVQGIDDVDHQDYRHQIGYNHIDFFKSEHPVERHQPNAGSREKNGGDNLADKFGAVLHSDEVVGHSDQIHHHKRAESETEHEKISLG